jgi:hypothetical protein
MNPSIKISLIAVSLSFCQFLIAQEIGFGVAPISENKTICISDGERAEIMKIIESHKSASVRERVEAVSFRWPIKQSANYDHSEVIGISNFVDLDSSYPNNLLDYNCGTRTYDTESGYNHKGTDIYSWPFTWHKMEHDHMQIVAAASGKIVYKQALNSDKSCSFNSNQWNAVYIEHADGSVAWYGHLKKNSLTKKVIGDQIEAGEFLGIMGSSGNSTGPHLHFEVYDTDNNLVDPYVGSCNSTTSTSWWEEQQDYTVPGINMLATHDAPPSLGCFGSETPYFEVNFANSKIVYFATYFRDQLEGSTSTHKIIKPDGSVFQQWTTTSPQFYSGSYWYRSFTLPSVGDEGKWEFQVEYQGQITTEYFYLTNESSQIELSQNTITFDDFKLGGILATSFEIQNTGSNGIRIENIMYPPGSSGNWDGLIHSSESKTIEFNFYPLTNEEFTEEVIITFNNSETKKLTLVGVLPLSLGEKVESIIYPNPVRNGEISISNYSDTSIELINLNGQVLLRSMNTPTLNVSGLKTGIYIIRIASEEKVQMEKVFIEN